MKSTVAFLFAFIFFSIHVPTRAAVPIRLPFKTESIRNNLDLGFVVGLNKENAFFSTDTSNSSHWMVSRLRSNMNPEFVNSQICRIPYYEGADQTRVTFFRAWSQSYNYKYDESGILTVGTVEPLWYRGNVYNFISYLNPFQGTCTHTYFPEGPLLHREQRFILGFYQIPRGYVAISNDLITSKTLVSFLDENLHILKEVVIPIDLYVLAAASDITSDELLITFFDEDLWRVKLADGSVTSVQFPGIKGIAGIKMNGEYALLANVDLFGLVYTLWHLPTGKTLSLETNKNKLDYADCVYDFRETTIYEACHPWFRPYENDPTYHIDHQTLGLRTYDTSALMPSVMLSKESR